MSMRITETMRFDQFRSSIQTSSVKLSELYSKLATQREISKPSDDPVKTGVILRLSSHLAALEQRTSSISTVGNELESVESTLTSVSDQMIRLRTLATNASNGTLSATDRASIAAEVNEIVESLVQDANTSVNGEYLFSGTKSDTAPFAVTYDGDGNIVSATYQGSLAERQASLGLGRSVSLGPTGQSAFVDNGVLGAAIQLRDDLLNTGGLSPEALAAALTSDLGAIADAGDALLETIGTVGARVSELDALAEQNETAITRATELLSEARDADTAQIAVDLSKEQMVYEALLSAAESMSSTNLFAYL